MEFFPAFPAWHPEKVTLGSSLRFTKEPREVFTTLMQVLTATTLFPPGRLPYPSIQEEIFVTELWQNLPSLVNTEKRGDYLPKSPDALLVGFFRMERETGLEPATPSLEGWRSTT
jgi:hypothetical protein